MIIDIHTHLISIPGIGNSDKNITELTVKARTETLIFHADRLGINKLCLSLGGGSLLAYPTPEELANENNAIIEAMELFPERIYGFCYVSPAEIGASLREMERCIEKKGMKGIKLWIAKRCNHRNVDPIVKKAIELDIPILQHTWLKATGNLPDESTPDDLAELAERFPEANFIMAHAGGKWEYGILKVKNLPNVLIDLAGGDPEAGITEMAVDILGANRVVYGSDARGRSFASQLAKVYGAEITNEQKELILWKNAQRLLKI